MGGGGGKQSQPAQTNTTTTVTQMPQISDLMDTVLPSVKRAYQAQPIENFQGDMPTGLAPLTDDQQSAITNIIGQQDKPILNLPEGAALNEMIGTLGSPIGSSPATQQGMAALEDQYNRNTLPSIQNQMALAGLGRSGALGDSIANARSGVAAAGVPLLTNEMNMRVAELAPALSFGQTLEGRPTGRSQQAFDASEYVRQISQAQEQEKQQNFLRNQAITESIANPLLGAMPATFGSQGTSFSRAAPSGIPVSASANLGGIGTLLGGGK